MMQSSRQCVLLLGLKVLSMHLITCLMLVLQDEAKHWQLFEAVIADSVFLCGAATTSATPAQTFMVKEM